MNHMKKSGLAVFCVMVLLLCTACSLWQARPDDNEIADATCQRIVQAIRAGDGDALKAEFSATAKDGDGFDADLQHLLTYVKGEIRSATVPSELGVAVFERRDHSKYRKQLESAFSVETTEGTYHFAVLEHVTDDFDPRNVGVISLYVIDAQTWTEDCRYLGDGKWSPGIHVERV